MYLSEEKASSCVVLMWRQSDRTHTYATSSMFYCSLSLLRVCADEVVTYYVYAIMLIELFGTYALLPSTYATISSVEYSAAYALLLSLNARSFVCDCVRWFFFFGKNSLRSFRFIYATSVFFSFISSFQLYTIREKCVCQQNHGGFLIFNWKYTVAKTKTKKQT